MLKSRRPECRVVSVVLKYDVQGDQILVSSEVSDETAFPRASWRARVLVVVGRVDGWEALGKAISAEAEPRSAAEPSISRFSR